MEHQTTKFSIKNRQQAAFDGAVENTKQANEAIKSAQNWVNVFALAQLAFLTSLLTQGEDLTCEIKLFIKAMIVLLLVSISLFLYGAMTQYWHLLGIARIFFSISDSANKILVKGVYEIDTLPSELEFPDHSQMKSSKLTNTLMSWSFYIVIFVSALMVVLIFFV